jgi:hypothetical protein
MENFASVNMESFDQIKGDLYEVYKIPINSEIYKIYYKDSKIYYPKNFLNEKKKNTKKKIRKIIIVHIK